MLDQVVLDFGVDHRVLLVLGALPQRHLIVVQKVFVLVEHLLIPAVEAGQGVVGLALSLVNHLRVFNLRRHTHQGCLDVRRHERQIF